jgi:hypothetical protein
MSAVPRLYQGRRVDRARPDLRHEMVACGVPGYVRKQPNRNNNKAAAREFHIKFGDDGEVIAREATL